MDDIYELIKQKDVDGIRQFMQEHNLIIKDNKIVGKDAETKKILAAKSEFWGHRQQARKILLNSLYGALLNEALRFYDARVGQSVTLSGRCIVKHMNAKINELITGIYDHDGAALCYSDTDSFANHSQIHTTSGTMSVEELFHLLPRKWTNNDKEYSGCNTTKVLSYDPNLNVSVFKNINYVYRHKVSKERWKITDQLGNEIICTGDHSVMIERDGKLMEMKPRDILANDILISVNDK